MRPLAKLAALTSVAVALTLAACQTPAAPPPSAPPAATANYDQLMADLRILSADDMEGRDTGAPGGERARAYIVSRLEALGIAAPAMGRLQPFEAQGRTREGPKTFNGTNILGVIPGTRVTDKYIVVTAHYDHVGLNGGQIDHLAHPTDLAFATALRRVVFRTSPRVWPACWATRTS